MRGSVLKRGKTWSFIVDAPQQAGQIRKREWHGGYRTKVEAEDALSTYLADRQRGTALEPTKITMGEFLDRWLEDHARVQVRPSTFASYRNQIRGHLIPGLGATLLTKLTALHIKQHYAKAMREGLSARSITYQHRLLRAALKLAVELRYIATNVADMKAAKPPAVERKEMHALSAQQVRGLLQAAAEDSYHALFYIAAYTGLRRAELIGLEWDDVDLERGMLEIRHTLQRLPGQGFVQGAPKTVKGRRQVEVPPSAVGVLRQHRTAQLEERLRLGPIWQDRGLVFTNLTGGPVYPPALSRRFHKALLAAELPSVRFHDLRHTHATLCWSRGCTRRS